ncbi:MAG: hypothetical protein QF449_01475 [Alphaproteobacteria bacterium]|jgi:hypothetical protein|nr:hypothetical protein [Alphaproteobacteria bacterium]MDP6589197.1 hypothetical protein [Alphaproteobacteria bacterium]MDP6816694.1 hypothetical protein [Alphaproteobacteria bacterium]
MTVEFTLAGYRELIAAILARGYEITDFSQTRAARRHLILRHDIDQCLASAARLAAVEAEQGWRASYFVLMRSEMYNPFSPAGLGALREIAGAGHEIGLHLDASIYGADAAALEAAVERECAMLESITGQRVSMISFHRPSPNLRPYDRILAGRGNTYESRFFDEIGYCSDSRGAWRHGRPRDHAAIAEGRALQLLTHAIWWVGEGDRPEDRLSAFLDRRFSLLETELAAHCAVHTPRKLKERI